MMISEPRLDRDGMRLRRFSGPRDLASDASWMARGGTVRKSKQQLRTTEISQ